VCNTRATRQKKMLIRGLLYKSKGGGWEAREGAAGQKEKNACRGRVLGEKTRKSNRRFEQASRQSILCFYLLFATMLSASATKLSPVHSASLAKPTAGAFAATTTFSFPPRCR